MGFNSYVTDFLLPNFVLTQLICKLSLSLESITQGVIIKGNLALASPCVCGDFLVIP